MKSAVISTVMLAVVILASAVFNTVIDSSIGSIMDSAKELPALPDGSDETYEIIKSIENEWNRSRPLISIGIADSHVEKIDKDIIELRAYFKTKENGGFMSAVDLLKEDLEKLRSVYGFELSNIF